MYFSSVRVSSILIFNLPLCFWLFIKQVCLCVFQLKAHSDFNFSYWHPGEPNSFENSDEDCGMTKFNEDKYNWNDEQCNKLNFWICEKMLA